MLIEGQVESIESLHKRCTVSKLLFNNLYKNLFTPPVPIYAL